MILGKRQTVPNPRKFLRSLFDCAVEVADPMRILADHLPSRPEGRVVVVGAGKASARMAEAVEKAWGPCEGLVITRDGHTRPTQQIEIVKAAHPVPDARGAEVTMRMLELLNNLDEDDFVLALISGGASSLLVAPCGDITLEEKCAVNEDLLAAGVPIDQLNTVRKHLSLVKGGQLTAAAYPARMLTLLISDVPGDDPAYIGSGPTVGDNSTSAEALAILERWKIAHAPSIHMALTAGTQVVQLGDPRLLQCENKIIAAPVQSLEAAASLARSQGIEVRVLGDSIEGEANVVGTGQAKLALDIKSQMTPKSAPILLLSGGELTVTHKGLGVGGPNAEFALALALKLNGAPGIYGIACDTDGVDGAAEVAGAIVDPNTLERAISYGLSPERALKSNDSHTFFSGLDDQVVTGPTMTNVNDFRAILVEP